MLTHSVSSEEQAPTPPLSLTFPFQCTGQVGVGFIFRHFTDVTLKLQIQVVTQNVPHLSSTLNRIPQGSLNQRVVCGPRIFQPQIRLEIQSPAVLSQNPSFSQVIPMHRRRGNSALVVTLGGDWARGWLLQSSEWPLLFLLLLQGRGLVLSLQQAGLGTGDGSWDRPLPSLTYHLESDSLVGPGDHQQLHAVYPTVIAVSKARLGV